MHTGTPLGMLHRDLVRLQNWGASMNLCRWRRRGQWIKLTRIAATFWNWKRWTGMMYTRMCMLICRRAMLTNLGWSRWMTMWKHRWA